MKPYDVYLINVKVVELETNYLFAEDHIKIH